MSNLLPSKHPPTALAVATLQGDKTGITNHDDDPSSAVAMPAVLFGITSKRRKTSVKKEPATKNGTKNRKFRRNWTQEEDAALMKIVKAHTFTDNVTSHWANIATKLNIDRTGKQCRDRYQCNLRPHIKKGSWTREEEVLIRQMHKSFGTKWSCMSKLMKHRTDNDIKNKWYSMMRTEKKLAEKAKENSSTQDSTSDGLSVAVENENTSNVPTVPTPFNSDDGPRQGYPATTGYTAGVRPGEFYLLSTQNLSATNVSLGNPYGSNVGVFYNPQQAHPNFVTEFGGSMMLIDSTGKAIGSAAPGKAGFNRYPSAESARMTNLTRQPGAAYGSAANMFKAHAQPSFIRAHPGAPNRHATNETMMPAAHRRENSGAFVKFANYGGENTTMVDVEAPEVKSMFRFGDTKIAPSNYDGAPLESNLDVLAEVGLAGGTLGTPFLLSHNETSFQAFKDPAMPVISSLNLDSATDSGGAAVMPNSCVSSPEPSMGAIAMKEEEL